MKSLKEKSKSMDKSDARQPKDKSVRPRVSRKIIFHSDNEVKDSNNNATVSGQRTISSCGQNKKTLKMQRVVKVKCKDNIANAHVNTKAPIDLCFKRVLQKELEADQ